jgi:thiol-disulfide isomerase/thioredoxin
MPRPGFSLLFCALVSLSALSAQSAAPPLAAAQTTADQARQQRLQAILDLDEPGQQMRALKAFADLYPQAPELAGVYNGIIQDAALLNDDHDILVYNQKLSDLDPADLSQRVKVLNLLLLAPDHAHQLEAQKQAAAFAQMVEEKAKEAPPDEMGPDRWRLNLARLRAVADLMQGAAAQNLGQYAEAEKFLAASLQQSQSEEAAEHLGQVEVALAKIPQAVDAYALALALPGQTIAQRAKLRATAAELYRQLHNGSDQGFGDLILRRFDEAAARDAAEDETLHPRAAVNAQAAQAGDFVLKSLDGAPHRLSADRGKVVIMDFWATWCGPCKIQHPILEALKQQFATNHNVIFVAVNEDEDPSRVAPFLASQHWAPTTWLDAGLGSFLGIDSLPTTLVLDPAGRIVYRQSGFDPETFQASLRAAIQRALNPAAPAR